MKTLRMMAGLFSMGLSYILLGFNVLYVIVVCGVYEVINFIWRTSASITEMLSPGDGDAVVNDMIAFWKWIYKKVDIKKVLDTIF